VWHLILIFLQCCQQGRPLLSSALKPLVGSAEDGGMCT
jgi:hypothetical protein